MSTAAASAASDSALPPAGADLAPAEPDANGNGRSDTDGALTEDDALELDDGEAVDDDAEDAGYGSEACVCFISQPRANGPAVRSAIPAASRRTRISMSARPSRRGRRRARASRSRKAPMARLRARAPARRPRPRRRRASARVPRALRAASRSPVTTVRRCSVRSDADRRRPSVSGQAQRSDQVR